jgi:hypothetical protein
VAGETRILSYDGVMAEFEAEYEAARAEANAAVQAHDQAMAKANPKEKAVSFSVGGVC